MHGSVKHNRAEKKFPFPQQLKKQVQTVSIRVNYRRMVFQIDTKNPGSVQQEAERVYRALYPENDPQFVSSAFQWVVDAFSGRYRDYQAIDASYHDLEHTLQGVLCLVRLLDGRHAAGAVPALSMRTFELALLAMLLHDSGYLKTKTDTVGTGAKYTRHHVQRSLIFTEQLLTEKQFPPVEIQAVQCMIRCTIMNVEVEGIPFPNEQEKIAGYAVGTADLLGQMAAPDYLEKLPRLSLEFAESTRAGAAPSPAEIEEGTRSLLQNTPQFWKNYVLPKITRDFGGLYRFLNDPFPDGPNPYMEQIEANLQRLKEII
jgi:hypothetical protein